MTEPNYTISESADKITLKTKVTRGTGTRDQEKYDLKVKGDTPTEVAQQMRELLNAMHAENLTENVRSMQPENDD